MLPSASPHRFLLRGGFCILNRSSCQATVAASLFRLTVEEASCCFFVGARNLLPFRLPCQLASSTRFFPLHRLCRLRDLSASAGGGFYHRRVSSQLRFVDRLFLMSFAASVGGPTAIAVSPVLTEGRGFYRLAVP